MIQDVADYIIENQDVKFRAWLFQNPAAYPLLSSTQEYGNSFKIYMVNHYDGRAPTYLSYQAIMEGLPIKLIPTAILDSHTVSLLTQYVNNKEKLPTGKAKAVQAFVSDLIRRGFDYNPFFYYMEATAKNTDGTVSNYALEAAKAIITLHTMDEERFLKDGTVTNSEELLEPYKAKYKCQTIDEVAYHNSQFMISKNASFPLGKWIDITYATILKMGLIHRKSPKGVFKKSVELRDFMIKEFDTYLGREHQISWFYFADLLDKFIPLQKTSKYPDILKKLRATAWDILLLRLPETLLEDCDNTEAPIAYICTSEKSLRTIGEASQLVAVQSMPPNYTMQPFRMVNLSEVQAKLGKEVVEKLLHENEEWEGKRNAQRLSGTLQPGKSLSFDRVDSLIEELETEIRLFCTV